MEAPHTLLWLINKSVNWILLEYSLFTVAQRESTARVYAVDVVDIFIV